MTTKEMEYFIARYFDWRQSIIVPNVSWGISTMHECDLLILSKSGYATEVEIKISKSDLAKDSNKRHGHINDKIKYLYYAFPGQVKEKFNGTEWANESTSTVYFGSEKHVPEKAGILLVNNIGQVVEYKKPQENIPYCWQPEEITQLLRLGNMRVWELKNRLIKIDDIIKGRTLERGII